MEIKSLWGKASKAVYRLWNKLFENLAYLWLAAMVGGLLFCAYMFVNADPEHLPEGLLFIDTHDVGMDHFNSIMVTGDRMPYTQHNITYPPLAAMIYYGFYSVMGEDAQELFENSAFGMRENTSTLLPYCLYLVICCVLIACLILKNVKISSGKQYAVILGTFLSVGFLSVLDRGNNVLLVTLLLLYYVFYYDSKNRFLSETALIALALATGIKLYPIVFGVLLIKKHRIAEGFRALGYIFLALFLPFFFFEGFDAMLLWIDRLFPAEKMIPIHPGALNFVSAIYNIETAYAIDIPDVLTTVFTYLFIVGGLLFAITSKKIYKAAVFCVFAILLFAGVTFEYFLFLCIVPMVYLFVRCDGIRDKIFAILIILVNIPLALPTPEHLEDTGIFQPDIWSSFLVLAIMLYILVDGAIDFVAYMKNKRWKYLFMTQKQLAKREISAWEE